MPRELMINIGVPVHSVDIEKNPEVGEKVRKGLRKIASDKKYTIDILVDMMEKAAKKEAGGVDFRNFIKYLELDMKETGTENGNDDPDTNRNKVREAISIYAEKHNINI